VKLFDDAVMNKQFDPVQEAWEDRKRYLEQEMLRQAWRGFGVGGKKLIVSERPTEDDGAKPSTTEEQLGDDGAKPSTSEEQKASAT
jgi:hypothetical protein